MSFPANRLPPWVSTLLSVPKPQRGDSVCKRVVEPEVNGRERGWCFGAFTVSPTQQAQSHLMIFILQPVPEGASEQLLQILGNSIVNLVLKGQVLARDTRN